MIQAFTVRRLFGIVSSFPLLGMPLAFPACGAGSRQAGDGATGSSNRVTGNVMGTGFRAVASAHWIGMPSQGSLPTQVFLSGAALDCATLSAPLWDKTIGQQPLLELAVRGTTTNTYSIPADADANYLPTASSVFNPTADSGTITISAVSASKSIGGSFEAHFGSDVLIGAFDATYCATGVEP
jgi:hypothetical protein